MTVMNVSELEHILPHRKPMLLLDEAEKTGSNTGISRCTIKGDEFFLMGHFPGKPVVPGVILCEILAQSACVLLSDEIRGKTPFFTGLDNVKFKQPVKPGDTFETECVLTKAKAPFFFAEGQGFVNGKLCVKASFSFAIVKSQEA